MAEILGWPTDGAADLPPTFLDAGGQPIRPNVTPEELELTEDQKMFLPRDERTGGGNWGQRNWGRISAWAAKPGDEMADAMFKEFAEIKEHMGIGLRRWAYNYTVTANNIAETVADKLGLPYEAKKNFCCMVKQAKRNEYRAYFR